MHVAAAAGPSDTADAHVAAHPPAPLLQCSPACLTTCGRRRRGPKSRRSSSRALAVSGCSRACRCLPPGPQRRAPTPARLPRPAQAASAPASTSTSSCRPAAAAASTTASMTPSAPWSSRGPSRPWRRCRAWPWVAAASWRWPATRACARRVRRGLVSAATQRLGPSVAVATASCWPASGRLPSLRASCTCRPRPYLPSPRITHP